MNPIFVIFVIASAAVLWLMLSGLFRAIGGIADHFIKKTEKALKDEPGNAEMFVKGFMHSLKNDEHDSNLE